MSNNEDVFVVSELQTEAVDTLLKKGQKESPVDELLAIKVRKTSWVREAKLLCEIREKKSWSTKDFKNLEQFIASLNDRWRRAQIYKMMSTVERLAFLSDSGGNTGTA